MKRKKSKPVRRAPPKRRAPVRKSPPKIKQIKRSLNKNEEVFIKNAKGQFRKHRKDLKVVVWVRNKKTGKTVGVKNSVKDGKPVPRRFSGGQITLISKPRVEAGFEVSARGDTFRIYSKEPIVWQLPKELPRLIRDNARLSPHGNTLTSFEIFYKNDFHLYTPGTPFTGDEKIADIRITCAKMIIDALYGINVRISAKVHTNRVKNRLRRYVDVTPQFSNF